MLLRLAPLAFSAMLLSGCNGTAPAPQAPAPQPQSYATRPYTDPNFKLPEGSACSSGVARFQAVMDNDYVTGNVSQGVYKQIGGEIATAREACAKGNDAESRALIAASKKRHGYPE